MIRDKNSMQHSMAMKRECLVSLKRMHGMVTVQKVRRFCGCLYAICRCTLATCYSLLMLPTIKGCKVIVVLRDPMDVLVSFYHFFEDWFFVAGEVSMDEFAQEFWLERGVPSSKMNNSSYFVHLASWYEHRNDPNVLVVCFEDLKENLEEQVRRVAKFMSTDKVSKVCD